MPCFIAAGPQKLWSPVKARWLLAAEKFCLMNFPTTELVANAYGCQVIDPYDLASPHAAIGNSMCVANCGLALMALLLSVDLKLSSMVWCVWQADGKTSNAIWYPTSKNYNSVAPSSSKCLRIIYFSFGSLWIMFQLPASSPEKALKSMIYTFWVGEQAMPNIW